MWRSEMPTHTQPRQKTDLQSFTLCSGSSRKCLTALLHLLLLPQPSPTCAQQPPFSPLAAWVMLQTPPNTAAPHLCPVAAGGWRWDQGLRGWLLPTCLSICLRTSHTLGQQATWKGMQRPHCLLMLRLSLRSLVVICHQERTNPYCVYSIRGCFYLHLSSLIAFERV